MGRIGGGNCCWQRRIWQQPTTSMVRERPSHARKLSAHDRLRTCRTSSRCTRNDSQAFTRRTFDQTTVLHELDREFPIARSITASAEGAPGRLTSTINLCNGLGFHLQSVSEDAVVIRIENDADPIPLKSTSHVARQTVHETTG